MPGTVRSDAGVTGDLDATANGLRILADEGAKMTPPIRFAYEAMCFSTFHSTWQDSWRLVRRVDRPNFGLVLDTFVRRSRYPLLLGMTSGAQHIAGLVYADPTRPGGVRENGAAELTASLDELKRTIDVSRVFYVQVRGALALPRSRDHGGAQVVDAERLETPLTPAHPFWDASLPYPRMMWSRKARTFPYEVDRGAYMPVLECAKAIVDLGFKGWLRCAPSLSS